MFKDDCLFCKIGKHEISAKIVYENERIIAFDDISPVAPVHVLVVPKVHVGNVSEIHDENMEIIRDVHLAIHEVAKRKGISGYRLIHNSGQEAGQTVYHLHYHVIGGKVLKNLI